MKKLLEPLLLCVCLCGSAGAKEVTLTVNSQSGYGPVRLSDDLIIADNESATVTSCYGAVNYSYIKVIKNGMTNSVVAYEFSYATGNHTIPITVAGPATLRLTAEGTYGACFCSVRVEPESFPPGQTLILPEGTVGVVHVESSTNLVQWQDEWVHTFTNTNQNRFFRLRAERSVP